MPFERAVPLNVTLFAETETTDFGTVFKTAVGADEYNPESKIVYLRTTPFDEYTSTATCAERFAVPPPENIMIPFECAPPVFNIDENTFATTKFALEFGEAAVGLLAYNPESFTVSVRIAPFEL